MVQWNGGAKTKKGVTCAVARTKKSGARSALSSAMILFVGSGGGNLTLLRSKSKPDTITHKYHFLAKIIFNLKAKTTFKSAFAAKSYVSRKPLLYRVNLKDVQLLRFFNCNLSETRQAFLTWFLCVKMFTVRLGYIFDIFLRRKTLNVLLLRIQSKGYTNYRCEAML